MAVHLHIGSVTTTSPSADRYQGVFVISRGSKPIVAHARTQVTGMGAVASRALAEPAEPVVELSEAVQELISPEPLVRKRYFQHTRSPSVVDCNAFCRTLQLRTSLNQRRPLSLWK